MYTWDDVQWIETNCFDIAFHTFQPERLSCREHCLNEYGANLKEVCNSSIGNVKSEIRPSWKEWNLLHIVATVKNKWRNQITVNTVNTAIITPDGYEVTEKTKIPYKAEYCYYFTVQGYQNVSPGLKAMVDGRCGLPVQFSPYELKYKFPVSILLDNGFSTDVTLLFEIHNGKPELVRVNDYDGPNAAEKLLGE